MKNKIDILKKKYRKELDLYSTNVREHVEKYGENPCDYLTHRRNMVHYYRGAYNALIELENK